MTKKNSKKSKENILSKRSNNNILIKSNKISKKNLNPTKKYNPEIIKLFNNGNDTRLLILPNRYETQTASIFFYFKVGSKNETPEINGISHFIEHMIFKGSPKHKSYLDISKTFDANGISFNAYTSKDITAYHFKFISTPENLNLICSITSDMILNPLMRNKDIQTERNVIIQEMKDDEDDIDEFINETIEQKILIGHPLANTIIGTTKTLHYIKQSHLINHHNKYYQPNNLLISFSGKYHTNYNNIINKYFKSNTNFKLINHQIQRNTEMIPFIDNNINTSVICIPKKLEQEYIHIIFKTKGYFDPLYLHYKLLANILAGNMSSRLFIEIREKLGLVYYIKCSNTNYEEVGYFDIYTQNEQKDTIKCIEHILLELQKIKTHTINETELSDNKKNYNDIFKTNFDDIEYENEYYSKQLLFNKPLQTYNERINNINKLTVNDIQTTAQSLFDFNKIHIITFGSKKHIQQQHKILNIISKYTQK